MSKANIRKNKKMNYNESEESDFECDSEYDCESEIEKQHEKIEIKRVTKANNGNARKKQTTSKKQKNTSDDEDFNINSVDDENYDDDDEELENLSSGSDEDCISDNNLGLGKKRKRNNSNISSIISNTNSNNNIKLTARDKKQPKEQTVKPTKKETFILDPNFNLEESYFYQELPKSQWDQVKTFITTFLKDGKEDKLLLKAFFGNYPKLKKGEQNMMKLKKITDDVINQLTITPKLFASYKTLSEFIVYEYYTCKPSILDCHFFPNPDNEVHVVNMLRTCKKTLDIAIFTLTNDKIYAGIEEAHKRGVKVRLIADDECCKMIGSDVVKVAAIGIPTKTDCNVRAHMHHKFAILDNSVVVTGSFNWTMQAVKMNQENILFYENKELANRYTDEYNKLWNSFTTVVDQKESAKKVKEEEDRKRKAREEKEKEREKKRVEKESKRKQNGNVNAASSVSASRSAPAPAKQAKANEKKSCLIF